MRIAFITLKDSPNYGGILQSYALQNAILKLGYEADLIDYMTEDFRHKFSFFGRPESMGYAYWLYKKAQYPLMRVMMRRMMPFYRHMTTTEKIRDKGDLRALNSEYDLFITGSDQVWAEDLNYGDASYYLDFVEGHPKISYAASFGRTMEVLTPSEKAFIRDNLVGFHSISVREDSGVEIASMLGGRHDVTPVLDPTLLLDRDDWEQVACHDHRGKGKKYILCYFLQKMRNDRDALAYAKRLSRQTGYPLIKVCRGLTSVIWGETTYVPTCEEWVGLFLDAEFVVTNSFHGMAFSVNFNKQFTSFVDNPIDSGRNSRIYDRCKDFGLLDRIEEVGSPHNLPVRRIDYDMVNPVIDDLRQKSMAFLADAIDRASQERPVTQEGNE